MEDLLPTLMSLMTSIATVDAVDVETTFLAFLAYLWSVVYDAHDFLAIIVTLDGTQLAPVERSVIRHPQRDWQKLAVLILWHGVQQEAIKEVHGMLRMFSKSLVPFPDVGDHFYPNACSEKFRNIHCMCIVDKVKLLPLTLLIFNPLCASVKHFVQIADEGELGHVLPDLLLVLEVQGWRLYAELPP